MSASSKKKIRKEQESAKLTERQRKEQKEAKKLKIYSIVFTAVIAVVLVAALTVMAIKGVENAGIVEKLTTALTIGEHKVNAVEMNYYYKDAVTKTYTQWETSYGNSLTTMLSIMGLDLTQPLDEQKYYDEDRTWADYFMDMAIENAHSDYALCDAAEAAQFTMPKEDELSLQSAIGSIEMQAMLGNYPKVDLLISAMYGPGANYKTYTEYLRRSTLANAFYNNYNDGLTYTADQIEAHAAEHPAEFNSYSYAEYKLNYTNFLGEGTEDAEGNVTYSDEDTAAAKDAAKAIAENLATAISLEGLDAAISGLDINKDAQEPVVSTKYENKLYSSLSEEYQAWLTAPERKVGDIGVLEDSSTSTDEDGNESTILNGYIVLQFTALNDNKESMSNVRHLLVTPEVETHEETGEEQVSEEAWNAAKEIAEMHLEEWKKVDGTEEGFIELVKESTEDQASAETGGLYENIHRDSNYEEAFLAWAIDPARTKGETGIVKTSYGYHVMYYVGNTETTYRDYMITEQLRAADMEAWYEKQQETYPLTRGNLSRVDTSSTLLTAAS